MIYRAANAAVLVRVPAGILRILDVGCGTGALGKALKARGECCVVGVTHSSEEAREARAVLDEVRVADLNQFHPDPGETFDCLICSHVLEHLVEPAEVLRRLKGSCRPAGRLVVALPNVLQWRQRLAFLGGRFEYADGGLMDRTHLRFYDWRTARALIEGAGYRVEEAAADGTFPASRFVPGLGRLLDRCSIALWPGLFGVQFLFVARPAETT